MPRTSTCAACHAAGRESCEACGKRDVGDVDIFALPPDRAIFSEGRMYRWRLDRTVAGIAGAYPEIHVDPGRPLVICGLNPSIANETDNDPTITREIDFARRWGCGRLVKVNAYAWVSTDPKAMFAQKKRNHVDIVGYDNDVYIIEAVQECMAYGGIFLAAWGANIEPFRQQRLAAMIGEIAQCLNTNKDGSPVHPLYQKADSKPRPWRLAA